VEYVRRLQAVNGGYLRSALNLDGIGLIAPVEDLVWVDIRGLAASSEYELVSARAINKPGYE
jgi:hypothetical protein